MLINTDLSLKYFVLYEDSCEFKCIYLTLEFLNTYSDALQGFARWIVLYFLLLMYISVYIFRELSHWFILPPFLIILLRLEMVDICFYGVARAIIFIIIQCYIYKYKHKVSIFRLVCPI